MRTFHYVELRADRNEPAKQEMQKQVDLQPARAHCRYMLKMWKTTAAEGRRTRKNGLDGFSESPADRRPRTYRADPARLLADPDRECYLVSWRP
jgi:hypothetical protein